MSKQRRYSAEFKLDAVSRMEHCETISGLDTSFVDGAGTFRNSRAQTPVKLAAPECVADCPIYLRHTLRLFTKLLSFVSPTHRLMLVGDRGTGVGENRQPAAGRPALVLCGWWARRSESV
jgi:hypothetical protein